MTERLEISTLTEEHASSMFHQLQAEEIYNYIPDNPPASIDSLREHYAMLIQGPSGDSERWLNWVVKLKDTNDIIGTLQATVFVEDRVASIAYILFPTYWGNGYAYEGVSWLTAYLQKTESIDKLGADIDTQNQRSINLIEKQGFDRLKTVESEDGEDYVYIKNC